LTDAGAKVVLRGCVGWGLATASRWGTVENLKVRDTLTVSLKGIVIGDKIGNFKVLNAEPVQEAHAPFGVRSVNSILRIERM
jgi:hypothetical protein